MSQGFSLSPSSEIMFEKSSASALAAASPPCWTRDLAGCSVAWPGSNGPSAWLSMPAIVRYRLTGPCALMICWKAVGGNLSLHLPAELRAETIMMFSR
jgi:hypothetical protein